jgi:hypothetical protein
MPRKPKVAPKEEVAPVDVPMPPLVEAMPRFTSERMMLLAPLITPRVWQLAQYRVCGGKLVKADKAFTVPDGEPVVKLALIVALEMWPHQRWSCEEEGVMRGMVSDNVNPHKKAGLIRAF